MNIYWSQNGYRCDSAGSNILNNEPPRIYYGEQPTWNVTILTGSGAAADLTGIASFRAAIDKDLSTSTTPMCRTLSSGISVSDNVISVEINARTAEFLAAVNGKSSVSAYFELWGFDSGAAPVFYLRIQIIASAVVDPDGGEPPEVSTGYITEAQARALLATAATVESVAMRADSTAYSAGDRVIYPGQAGYVLLCTTAGTSDASAPSFPASVTSGTTTLADGTVTWTIYDATKPEIATVNGLSAALAAKADASALAAKAGTSDVAMRADSTAYSVGDRVLYPGQAGYILICTTAGTSAASAPSFPASVTSGTTTLTDGTAVWTLYDATAPEIGTVVGLVDSIGLVKRSTTYGPGARVVFPGKPGYLLRFETGHIGITAAAEPSFPSAIVSGTTTLTDGTVVWTIYDATKQEIATVNGLAEKLVALQLWQPSTAYAYQDRVTYPGKPGFVLLCTTAGTTGSTSPSFPATPSSGVSTIESGVTTISDGTVVWTVYDLTWINRYQDRLNANCPVDYVIYKATGTSSWYRIWKSGWVEQGGTKSGGSTASGAALNFSVKFASPDFTITYSVIGASATTAVLNAKTLATSIPASGAVSGVTVLTTVAAGGSNSYNAMTFEWYACGKGDETEIETIIDGAYGYRY